MNARIDRARRHPDFHCDSCNVTEPGPGGLNDRQIRTLSINFQEIDLLDSDAVHEGIEAHRRNTRDGIHFKYFCTFPRFYPLFVQREQGTRGMKRVDIESSKWVLFGRCHRYDDVIGGMAK